MAGDRPYAVSMGDLVGSSRAADRAELHRLFNRRIDEANERFATAIASPLTITLGDEFQGLASTLEAAFEISRFVRFSLLVDGAASRVVVGAAKLDTDLNPEKAWNMMGPGLPEARRKLSDKKDPNCYRFSMPAHETLELLLDGVGRSLTRTEEGWTDTQLAYVAEVSAHPDEPKSRAAGRLGISDNSLYKVLRAADYRFYTEQIETIRAALRLHDRDREVA